jgi:hypothetical protein
VLRVSGFAFEKRRSLSKLLYIVQRLDA